MKVARSAVEVTPIGFAEGEGASLIRQALVPILDIHPLRSTTDPRAETGQGFPRRGRGEPVVVMIYQEGKFAGELATSFVPKVSQLANWG